MSECIARLVYPKLWVTQVRAGNLNVGILNGKSENCLYKAAKFHFRYMQFVFYGNNKTYDRQAVIYIEEG